MLLPSDFDCELHDWILVMYPAQMMTCPTIVGVVQNDKKRRFADGRTIRTSVLLSPIEDIHAGAVVQTLNTRYLLVGPAAKRN
jgi:hypothetical protein